MGAAFSKVFHHDDNAKLVALKLHQIYLVQLLSLAKRLEYIFLFLNHATARC